MRFRKGEFYTFYIDLQHIWLTFCEMYRIKSFTIYWKEWLQSRRKFTTLCEPLSLEQKSWPHWGTFKIDLCLDFDRLACSDIFSQCTHHRFCHACMFSIPPNIDLDNFTQSMAPISMLYLLVLSQIHFSNIYLKYTLYRHIKVCVNKHVL